MVIKKKKSELTHQKVIVWLGYILFGLIIIGTIFSTIVPWGQLLLQPHVRHWNVSVILVTLVAGAILPTLIAYFIGDKTTRGKNRLMHHYNGVLFGVLAYWFSTSFNVLGSEITSSLRMSPLPDVLVSLLSLWPTFVTIVILSILAITHSRSRKKDSVLAYTPYRVLLLISLASTFMLPLFGEILDHNFSGASFMLPAAAGTFITISYVVLRIIRKDTWLNCLLLALVALSMVSITLYATILVLTYGTITSEILSIILPVLLVPLSVVVWVLCLWSARTSS